MAPLDSALGGGEEGTEVVGPRDGAQTMPRVAERVVVLERRIERQGRAQPAVHCRVGAEAELMPQGGEGGRAIRLRPEVEDANRLLLLDLHVMVGAHVHSTMHVPPRAVSSAVSRVVLITAARDEESVELSWGEARPREQRP